MDETHLTLLERLQSDRASDADWQKFDSTYRPFFLSWLQRRGIQTADAEDVTQETLLKVRRGLPAFQRRAPGDLRRWLRTVLANCLRDDIRQRARKPERGGAEAALETLADPDSAISRIWDEEHDHYLVTCLLERVRPDFSAEALQLFRVYVLEGRSADEAAARFGVSVDVAYQTKARVLRRLREAAEGLLD